MTNDAFKASLGQIFGHFEEDMRVRTAAQAREDQERQELPQRIPFRRPERDPAGSSDRRGDEPGSGAPDRR